MEYSDRIVDGDEGNPYKAPESPATFEPIAFSDLRRRCLVAGWACSLAVLGYGLFGVVGNGLDLARTQSARDLVTELRLLIVLGIGCLLCSVMWLVQRRRRVDRISLRLCAAVLFVCYVVVEGL